MKQRHYMLRKAAAIGLAAALCCIPQFLAAKEHAKQNNSGISYEVDIDHPVFEAEPLLNTQVTDLVQQTLQAFNKEAFSARSPAFPQMFELDIENSSIYEDTTHISFLLKVYQFTGGAHGSTTHIPVTYSKQTKKLLSLEEVLRPARKDWLAVLAEEARKQLKAQVQKQKLASTEDWIMQGTEPAAENFSVFKLEKDAVRIIFAQYQVEPYSSGMPEITVPRTLFK